MPQTVIVLMLLARNPQKIMIGIIHGLRMPVRDHKMLHARNFPNINHRVPPPASRGWPIREALAVHRDPDWFVDTTS